MIPRSLVVWCEKDLERYCKAILTHILQMLASLQKTGLKKTPWWPKTATMLVRQTKRHKSFHTHTRTHIHHHYLLASWKSWVTSFWQCNSKLTAATYTTNIDPFLSYKISYMPHTMRIQAGSDGCQWTEKKAPNKHSQATYVYIYSKRHIYFTNGYQYIQTK